MFSKFFPNFKVSPLIASAAIAGAALAMAGLGASTASASVIYSDSFTGGTANLDGASPTVDNGTSTVWTAGSQDGAGNGAGGGVGWSDSGYSNVGNALGSAYLSFVPSGGHIYTLAAGIDVTSEPQAAYYDLQLGFIGSPNTTQKLDSSGYAYASVGQQGYANLWSGPGVYAASLTTNNNATNTFSITLNTTALQWTYEFTVDGTSTTPTAFATNPTITAVGLGNTGGQVGGTFSNFSLTESSVPEPASLGLLAVGGLGLLLLGKRRHA